MRIARSALVALTVALAATAAPAATFGELGAPAPYPMPAAGPYAPAPVPTCPPECPTPMFGGPEGTPPGAAVGPNVYDTWSSMARNPGAYLPVDGHGAGPHGQIELWSFGQMNSTTDPFNPWGLSTPYMFVPWSTPMSAWSNAQTWNWWRERSGALPRNW